MVGIERSSIFRCSSNADSFELKIGVIGNAGVGKTALVNALLCRQKHQNGPESSGGVLTPPGDENTSTVSPSALSEKIENKQATREKIIRHHFVAHKKEDIDSCVSAAFDVAERDMVDFAESDGLRTVHEVVLAPKFLDVHALRGGHGRGALSITPDLVVVDIPAFFEVDHRQEHTAARVRDYMETHFWEFSLILAVLDPSEDMGSITENRDDANVALLQFVQQCAAEYHVPILVVVNKMDHESGISEAARGKILESIREKVFTTFYQAEKVPTCISMSAEFSLIYSIALECKLASHDETRAFSCGGASVSDKDSPRGSASHAEALVRELGKQQFEKLGLAENGEFRWKGMSNEQKEHEIARILKDKTNLRSRLRYACGFCDLLSEIDGLLGTAKAQNLSLLKKTERALRNCSKQAVAKIQELHRQSTTTPDTRSPAVLPAFSEQIPYLNDSESTEDPADAIIVPAMQQVQVDFSRRFTALGLTPAERAIPIDKAIWQIYHPFRAYAVHCSFRKDPCHTPASSSSSPKSFASAL